jgi:hypothetical protein
VNFAFFAANQASPLDTIDLAQLPLLTLDGKPANLAGQFDNYLLLIFLRHLA